MVPEEVSHCQCCFQTNSSSVYWSSLRLSNYSFALESSSFPFASFYTFIHLLVRFQTSSCWVLLMILFQLILNAHFALQEKQITDTFILRLSRISFYFDYLFSSQQRSGNYCWWHMQEPLLPSLFSYLIELYCFCWHSKVLIAAKLSSLLSSDSGFRLLNFWKWIHLFAVFGFVTSFRTFKDYADFDFVH